MIPVFSNSLGEQESRILACVFESRWTGMGPHTQKFESELEARIGKRVLLTNCCTASLFMAMELVGVKGREVIIPTVNFLGVPNAVLCSGGTPVFADVDSRTLNILPDEILRLRTDKTAAVVLLHYGGHPCDMQPIYDACDGISIVEDNANSPFSKWNGKPCGALGDIGCFSFDSMKILSMGNGGAICVGDDLLERAMELRYLGMASGKQSGVSSIGSGGNWWDLSVVAPSNRYVSCDILAAIGRVQLEKVDDFIACRKDVWEQYQQELCDLDWLQTPPEPLCGCESSYYLYWVKTLHRDALARYLLDKGIYCTFKYHPLHTVEAYGKHTALPNAEEAAKTVLNIPLHQNLSPSEINFIIKSIREFKCW